MFNRTKRDWIKTLLLVICISLFAPMNGVFAATEPFLRGVDISTLQVVEDGGGAYYANGKKQDLLAILKVQGINYVRLRIWNNPTQANNYNNLDDTIRMAKRVKKAGLKLLLDFHYSDYWADPGKQNKPDAWKNLTQPQLEQAVYSYTKQVVTQLRK
jgi:arabinogalactan endo-1,4-beta-galactosidase